MGATTVVTEANPCLQPLASAIALAPAYVPLALVISSMKHRMKPSISGQEFSPIPSVNYLFFQKMTNPTNTVGFSSKMLLLPKPSQHSGHPVCTPGKPKMGVTWLRFSAAAHIFLSSQWRHVKQWPFPSPVDRSKASGRADAADAPGSRSMKKRDLHDIIHRCLCPIPSIPVH